ncbi:MAG: helix-turn-helix domain-containing protein [Clostridia bacterium]|nr:helix-turn-helix domain-containing protein [Clostridia bacterium]
MDHTSLSDLIWSIEYGTKIHLCIVFLNDYGNHMTKLSGEHIYHSKPFCEYMKSQGNSFKQCVACRNRALKKAIEEKQGFGRLCCNGVYEYCYPVICDKEVAAVIFLGNILSGGEKGKNSAIEAFYETFEHDFSEDSSQRICEIVAKQILLLLKEYSNVKSEFPVLITNIRHYLEDMIFSDVSVSDIAAEFNYSEKYIGRLFKKHTGKTIKEYVGEQRLQRAVKLLFSSEYTITEISVMTGFNNLTYFCRKFKEQYGISPRDYQKSLERSESKL